MDKGRIGFLDVFRGLAAVCIVIFHYTLLYSMNYREMFQLDSGNLGWMTFGVQMFYIISGFVVYRSSLNYTDAFTFAKRRVFRMYPTFLLSLILTTLFVFFFPHKVFSISAWQFVLNLTMMGSLFGVDSVDGSYWYLIPEIFFYFFMSGLVMFKLQHKILYVCAVWLVMIFLNTFRPSFIETIFNLRFGLFFIVGILFCRVFYKQSTWIEHFMILACLLVSYVVFGDGYRTFGFLLLIIILYLLTFGVFEKLENSFFRFLANISYPLFLIHQTIGITILDFFVENELNYGVSVFIVTLIAIGIATSIHYFYELPLLRMITKKHEKKKNSTLHC